MELYIKYQESYSRGQLLMRAFFGFFYILLPHGIMLMLLGIVGYFYSIIGIFSVLFTGTYPESMFQFQVGLQRWNLRVSARMLNLVDGTPPFGRDAEDDLVNLEVPYLEKQSQGDAIKKFFLGFFMIIPHAFVLYFRAIGMMVLSGISFWVILFTGHYPPGWHKFVVETLRYSVRVGLYFGFLNDKYPPFSGKTDEELGLVG
ncbi:MAG TPA: hypothetical protein DCS93_03160 [Microscillaceae bacterium]|nr:hypothetical protein [Microscillaceae bacterium]